MIVLPKYTGRVIYMDCIIFPRPLKNHNLLFYMYLTNKKCPPAIPEGFIEFYEICKRGVPKYSSVSVMKRSSKEAYFDFLVVHSGVERITS